jgi:hypothetical protein
VTFADLFRTAGPEIPRIPHLRRVRRVESPSLMSFKTLTGYHALATHVCIAEDSGVAPSAPSAFVPLDLPFAEGKRYRKAGATEWPGRLDLYRTDPAGPWVRRHGVMLKVPEP